MRSVDTSNITVLDFDRVSMQKINVLEHVHDLSGICRKNRNGPRCERRVDNQKTAMLQ